MIRSRTISGARIEENAPAKVVQMPQIPQVPAIIPKDDGKLANAIVEFGKSNEENAKLLREALVQILSARQEAPKVWKFEVIADDDIHSNRYGMMKYIIATSN